LQKRWKEVGAVSRRHSDAVWKRFRAACDYFFERKAAHFSSVDNEQERNLQAKRELLEQMKACDVKEGGFEAIKAFQRKWSEIGYVPIKQKDALQKQYKEVVDAMFATLRGSEHDRSMDRFRSKLSSMKASGEKRLRSERERLYNKVKQLEADIALLENNIGFFAHSKNAESMINDVRVKIEKAKAEMAETIEKVKLIDSEESAEN
jgi:predicted ribosome quality control (RQC) complex YloA/Tae2 family protein